MREAYTELDQRVVRRTAALERASAALRERNALLNAITTSTPDLIFAKDRQGRLLMANPAWSRAVGKSAEEAGSLDDNERLVLEAGETMIVEELLNALRGWSHLLATTRPLDGTLVERASKAIKRNVDHQTRLIDDLLDTSRIVSGKLTIERRVVNLVDTVHAALDAARPVAQAKH